MHLLLDNLDISFVMSRVSVLKFVSYKATCVIEKTKMIEINNKTFVAKIRFYESNSVQSVTLFKI